METTAEETPVEELATEKAEASSLPPAAQLDGGNGKIYNERLRLATLEMDDFIKIGFAATIVGLLYLIYHFQGNTTDMTNYSRSAIQWMMGRWGEKSTGGTDFSHGYIIPFVSIGIIYWKRKELVEAPKSVSKIGLVLFVSALILHWLGARVQHPRISLGALVVILWAVPLYFYGWKMARILLFPCGYLMFCIPMNFLERITMPLRKLASVIGAESLNAMGLMVERQGTILRSATGSFNFNVEDPCSGLRSLLAMTALTAVYAYLTQKSTAKKWALFLAAVPLAILGNIFRITSIGLVAEAFGQELAGTLYHDYSGYIVFAVAIGFMVITGSLLNLDWKDKWKQWKQKLMNPTSASPETPASPA